MTVRILPCLVLLLCFIFGANVPAWAQICPGGTTPICKDIEGVKGTFNTNTGKCDYSPVCQNTGLPPVNGVCSAAGNTICPDGSTGTPPNCVVSARVCPIGSTEENGVCKTGDVQNGSLNCPSPSYWDSGTQKCLLEPSLPTMSLFCPSGYYLSGASCIQEKPCPGTNIYSERCIIKPDPAEVCNYIDNPDITPY